MNTFVTTLRSRKIIAFGIADVVFTSLALWSAFLVRFEGIIPPNYPPRLPLYAGMLAILNIYFFWNARLYSFTWSFVGLTELTKLLKSVTYASIIFSVIVLGLRNWVQGFAGFPSSILFINYILTLVFIGALRISKRVVTELMRNRRRVTNGTETLIVGAGNEGEALIRAIAKSSHYKLVGIVDNSPTKQRSSIHGFSVLGTIDQTGDVIRAYNVKQLIIALTSAEASTIKHAITLAREAKLNNIKIIPATHELLSGTAKLTDFREIQIEDLLGRNPARIDTAQIASFIGGKNVFITGASGSIGSELARQCVGFSPKTLFLIDFNESGIFDLHAELLDSAIAHEVVLLPVVANVNNESKIERLIEQHKPDIIFHAAAYKHVPLMEVFPEEAVATNIFGTLNVAKAAAKYKVPRFVLISTDKAIRPVSVMGKTKRAAELAVQALNRTSTTKFIAVRFGNVIGSRGSVIPLFQEQIRRRSAVTVTHQDMMRYFMTIPEAALLVMEAGSVGTGGEIFMLDMGKPVKIADIARETIRLAGLEPDVDIPIVFTGIRPGEKIFEEIFSDEEKRVGVTQWEKIFITRTETKIDASTLEKKLKALSHSLTHNTNELLQTLDDLVGSTSPQNQP